MQLPTGGSAVAIIQQMLGDKVRVVSAFQNVAAHTLRDLEADIGCDVLVCGDDAGARAVALELIAKIGLRGLDAGPICNSAAAEALTSILDISELEIQSTGLWNSRLPDWTTLPSRGESSAITSQHLVGTGVIRRQDRLS